jgi:predicted amidohydrolase
LGSNLGDNYGRRRLFMWGVAIFGIASLLCGMANSITTLLAARALDTTCYIVAAGECGTRNIGLSRIVDPLGTTLAGAGSEPQLIFADLLADDLARVRERLPVLRNRRFAPPQLL